MRHVCLLKSSVSHSVLSQVIGGPKQLKQTKKMAVGGEKCMIIMFSNIFFVLVLNLEASLLAFRSLQTWRCPEVPPLRPLAPLQPCGAPKKRSPGGKSPPEPQVPHIPQLSVLSNSQVPHWFIFELFLDLAGPNDVQIHSSRNFCIQHARCLGLLWALHYADNVWVPGNRDDISPGLVTPCQSCPFNQMFLL